MKKWMLIVSLLGLGGCATPHDCNTSMVGSQCRADYLLFQNDMLQAKWVINQRHPENYELANALLSRAAHQDNSGEARFYQAVLMLRMKLDDEKVNDLLQDSADRKYPLALALLAQRVGMHDQEKARAYRAAYEKLDVAKSGYPSFDQALVVVNALVSGNN